MRTDYNFQCDVSMFHTCKLNSPSNTLASHWRGNSRTTFVSTFYTTAPQNMKDRVFGWSGSVWVSSKWFVHEAPGMVKWNVTQLFLVVIPSILWRLAVFCFSATGFHVILRMEWSHWVHGQKGSFRDLWKGGGELWGWEWVYPLSL